MSYHKINNNVPIEEDVSRLKSNENHMVKSKNTIRNQLYLKVIEGEDTVLYFQSFRTYILDIYFSCITIGADEIFYLIGLPLLFWCYFGYLAIHLTHVVCIGLVLGNYVKDMFHLPRPTRVWVPNWLKSTKTNHADYGFPSTHAMNAVSNSIFTFLCLHGPFIHSYLSRESVDSNQSQLMIIILKIVTVLFWIVNLSLSRMYLGVHSLPDIIGGMLIGFVWVFCYYYYIKNNIDELTKASSTLAIQLACILSAFISTSRLFNITSNKPSASFYESFVSAGLSVGGAQGCIMVITNSLFDISFLHSLIPQIQSLMLSSIIRVLIGIIIIFMIRTIAKVALKEITYVLFNINVKTTISAFGCWTVSANKLILNAIVGWSIVYFVPSFLFSLDLLDREKYEYNLLNPLPYN